MQRVESADEVRSVMREMRFTSKGGTRSETDLGVAPAYWGLTREQYLQKADIWPLNPNGELLVFVIIESKEGIAKAREIMSVPGIAAVAVGAGTLGGVFTNTTTNPDGTVTRTRDQAAYDAGIQQILDACKATNVPCGYPANNPAEVQDLMAKGYKFFIMQQRNQASFDAVLKGRELSNRPMTP
jgi:2-keto-3-deoxy-L-rhamnonate aldolase RhmA